MSSLQDVFKDFEYEGDGVSVEESFFHETFSQLKESEQSPESNTTTASRVKVAGTANLADFEEAFTALKSIQSAHQPSSLTAITAFLHYRRGIQT